MSSFKSRRASLSREPDKKPSAVPSLALRVRKKPRAAPAVHVAAKAVPARQPPKPPPAKLVKSVQWHHDTAGLPLTERYRPTQKQQLLGNQRAVNRLVYWVSHRDAKNAKKAALLSGPPGVGKTTAAHVVLTEAGHGVREINASETRTGVRLIDLLNKLTRTKSVSNDGKSYAVVVDEVDGIYEADGATMAALVAWVNKLKPELPPVVFVCNERWQRSMRALAEVCEDIRFQHLATSDLYCILRYVVHQERTQLSREREQQLVCQAGGDARRMINLIGLGNDSSVGQLGMYDTCKRLMSQRFDSVDVLCSTFAASEDTFWMIHENYPRSSLNSKRAEAQTLLNSRRFRPDTSVYNVQQLLGLEDMAAMADLLSAVDITDPHQNDFMYHVGVPLGCNTLTQQPTKMEFPSYKLAMKAQRDTRGAERAQSRAAGATLHSCREQNWLLRVRLSTVKTELDRVSLVEDMAASGLNAASLLSIMGPSKAVRELADRMTEREAQEDKAAEQQRQAFKTDSGVQAVFAAALQRLHQHQHQNDGKGAK